MIKISELEEYYRKYSPTKTVKPVEKFIEFIREDQLKNKKGGVVSMEEREAGQRLREIEAYQAENAGIDPEEDIKNL